MGDTDAHPGRDFGSHVAIEGGVAVIAAAGFKKGNVACGAAYVFARRDGAWSQTQRLDSPRVHTGGFASRVAVADGRVFVFGGKDDIDQDVFRVYARDGESAWKQESEHRIGAPFADDAVAFGDTVAVGLPNAVVIWRLEGGAWREVQRIDAPVDKVYPAARFGAWLGLTGDTLAVHSGGGNEPPVRDGSPTAYVYRRTDGDFELETTLAVGVRTVFTALARGGAALLWSSEQPPLVIEERGATGWVRTLANEKAWGTHLGQGRHPAAADGALVVASSPNWQELIVLEHRPGGWYRAPLLHRAARLPEGVIDVRTPPQSPNVALSGRSAIVGTRWDSAGSGRAWFFDITDNDLARATKLESDVR